MHRSLDFSAEERLEKAKQREHKRIVFDRFRVIVILLLFLVLFLSAFSFGIALVNVRESFRTRASLTVSRELAFVILRIAKEAIASFLFVSSHYPTVNDISAEVLAELFRLQGETQKAILGFGKYCPNCPMLVEILNINYVFSTQHSVYMRLFDSKETLLAYQVILERAVKASYTFLSEGIHIGTADIVWMNKLFATSFAVDLMVPGSLQSTTLSKETVEGIYDNMTRSIQLFETMNRSSNLLVLMDSKAHSNFVDVIASPYEECQAAVDQYNVTLSGLSVMSGDTGMSPLSAMNSLINTYSTLVDALENDGVVTESVFNYYLISTLTCGVAIVFCIVAIIIFLVAVMRILFISPEYYFALRHQDCVECSLNRMELFIQKIYELDIKGMQRCLRNSIGCKGITQAEKDVLAFGPRVLQVLSFVNPLVFLFTKLHGFHGDEPQECAVFYSSEDDRALSEGSVRPSPALGKDSAPGNLSPNPLELTCDPCWKESQVSSFVVKHLNFLLIDISCFYGLFTLEKSKGLPLVIESFMSELLLFLDSTDGQYITTAGTTAIAFFPEECESNLVLTLIAFEKRMLSRYKEVHCALLFTSAPQGLVVTEALKTFLTDGSVLFTGELMLKVARLHKAQLVTNITTFLKMEEEFFYKRALEKVALEEGTHREIIAVYEIVNPSNDKGSYLWNQAYDAFHCGDYQQAREKLKTWKRKFSSTDSYRRIMRLLNAQPQPQTVSYFLTKTQNFDLDFSFDEYCEGGKSKK